MQWVDNGYLQGRLVTVYNLTSIGASKLLAGVKTPIKVGTMKRSIAASLSVMAMLSACTTTPRTMDATYFSPAQFESYSCEQLSAEVQRIQAKVNQLISNQGDNGAPPTNNQWILGAAMSLSWPVLFALGGTKEQEAEYMRLKSEYDAIQQWAVAKKCPGVIPPAETPPPFDPNMVEDERIQDRFVGKR